MRWGVVILCLVMGAFPIVASSATLDLFATSYVFHNGLSNSPLTPGDCVQAGAGGLLTTTSLPCGSGTGTHTEAYTVTASAITPYHGTVTFATPYSTAPICVATSFWASPTIANIVSETTTNVVIYDASQQGATFNVSCTGT